MLDLPDPFGPDTVVKPRLKGMTVLPWKDLKLSISICWMCKWGDPYNGDEEKDICIMQSLLYTAH